MRYGFTTGSCAAAAAKAAAYMLLSGYKKETITIETPKGIDFHAQILEIDQEEWSVSCSVEKDGGDDPDVTTGLMIRATVTYDRRHPKQILIEGGDGVGRVTKPGLDQPVGNAAINSVPRQMIEKEVREVMDFFDCEDGLSVLITVQGGEEVAQKTFNPRLGIVGGISILGTSGIVEPMSEQALIDTIRVECRQKRALGETTLFLSPGNYGLDFMKSTYDYDLNRSVKCSNFIGVTMDIAREIGFQQILLTGHIGKLIKVAGGIMNTHSKETDCRMEIMAANAIEEGFSLDCIKELMQAATTEEALRILFEEDESAAKHMMSRIVEKIRFYLQKRAGDAIQVEVILFSNDYGLLAETQSANEMISR